MAGMGGNDVGKMKTKALEHQFFLIIHHDQDGFIPGMQGWYNIPKTINILHYMNKGKPKIT